MVRRWMMVMAGVLVLVGCKPKHNMDRQPYYKPYRPTAFFVDGMSERPLVAGVVPRPVDRSPGIPYVAVRSPGPAGYPSQPATQRIPFPVTAEVLKRGQEQFNIYCSMCHGRLGDGRGMIPQRGLTPPPSYHIDRLRQASDLHFYDVMTNGYGAMFSYNDRVTPADRWAIVAYIRTLQAAVRDASDLTPQERQRLAGTRP